jgi:carboxylesterase
MDPEKTAPFELGSGDDACLLLHGFTGSPWDVRPLGERLAERGYYVRAIRLPGHGSTPLAMAQVTHRDWEQAAEEALFSLQHFRHVFLGGLSMGALLALLLAARHHERVHGVAALAPAMRFREPRMKLLERLQRWPVLELVKPFVEKTGTDIEDPDARAEAPILPSFPVVRLRDVFHLQRSAREALPLVRSPVLIAAADRDRVVLPEGARELARGLVSAPAVRFIRLTEGAHIVTRDRARELVAAEVGEFFERIRAGR